MNLRATEELSCCAELLQLGLPPLGSTQSINHACLSPVELLVQRHLQDTRFTASQWRCKCQPTIYLSPSIHPSLLCNIPIFLQPINPFITLSDESISYLVYTVMLCFPNAERSSLNAFFCRPLFSDSTNPCTAVWLWTPFLKEEKKCLNQLLSTVVDYCSRWLFHGSINGLLTDSLLQL